jgi:hypothetical protein
MNNHIKELVIDGNEIFDFASHALNFPNIEDVEFRYCDFNQEDILKLIEFKEYERIAFIRCTFENEDLIKYLKTKSLSLTNNKISNYDFVSTMAKLERLTIVEGRIDINKLNKLNNLVYLRISNSIATDIDNIKLDKLKYLFIDNTNIINLNFIAKLPNLELLSISKMQEENNKEVLNKLKAHIKIIYNSIIRMDVENEEV